MLGGTALSLGSYALSVMPRRPSKVTFGKKRTCSPTIDERAPSSQFGVSCVACHQVNNVVKTKPFKEAEKFGLDDVLVDYKNLENLEYVDAGRTMFGTIDNDHQVDGSIVGNSTHKGQFATHLNDSSFCASCHTVMVDPDGLAADRKSSNIVTLQNTYHEWKEGSSNPNAKETAGSTFVSVNWDQLGVNCMDCHSKPLDDLEIAAERMQNKRTDLRDSRRAVYGVGGRQYEEIVERSVCTACRQWS